MEYSCVAGEELLPDKSQIFSLLTGCSAKFRKWPKNTRRTQIPVCVWWRTASRYKVLTKADYASVCETILERLWTKACLRWNLVNHCISNRSPAWSRWYSSVNSSGAIAKLLSFDLILRRWKKKSSGVLICMSRRIILDYMGINHLREELPKVEEVDIDQRKVNYFQREQRN